MTKFKSAKKQVTKVGLSRKGMGRNRDQDKTLFAKEKVNKGQRSVFK